MNVALESVSSKWTTLPFGRLMARSKEADRPDLPPLSVYLDAGVVPRSTRDDNHNRLGADMSNYLVVRPGDIVFNKLRTWQGGLGVSSDEGVVSPAYFVCRPNAQVDSRYFHYLLRSAPYLAELTRISKFMPPSQFDIAWDDLKAMLVPRPPLAEQRAIADYLDAETARIDALIAKKQQLINLLEERIDSEVRTAIGRSSLAQPNGEPAVELRRFVERRLEWATEGDMITAFRDGQVTTRSLRGRDGFTDSWTEGSRVKRVQIGDLVVHGLDGFSGAIGDSESEGVCSPVYHVLFGDRIDGALVGRLLRILAIEGYLGNFAVSTRERAVDFRNWDLFGRIPIPRIELRDQKRIGDMIRAIRPLKSLVQSSEKLANERRQALTTRAVTGELEIEASQ